MIFRKEAISVKSKLIYKGKKLMNKVLTDLLISVQAFIICILMREQSFWQTFLVDNGASGEEVTGVCWETKVETKNNNSFDYSLSF